MQEGTEGNKPTRESRKAFREYKRDKAETSRIQGRKEKQTEKFNKALAEDDAETGFVSPSRVEAPAPNASSALSKTLNKTKQEPKAFSAVLNAISKDNNISLNDYSETAKTASVAAKEEEKQNALATTLAVKAVEDIQESNDIPDEESSIYQQSKSLAEGALSEGVLAGSGGTVKKIMDGASNQRPTAEQYYTKEDIQREIAKSYADNVDSSANLAIDKIGLEDYYPNIGKDIAVGTYSGKYIGSATIFSAPGARLPMGLYDARKRALKEQAQSKQAALDKIMTLPDTSAQFDARFKELKYNELYGFLEKANFDADALSRDPDFMKWSYNTNSKAKEIINANEWAKQVEKDGADKEKYTPDEALELAYKIKLGQVDDFESFVSGNDKNFTSLLEGANTYLNALPEVQKAAEFMLKPENMSQEPINLKTGGVYDKDTFIKERNDFLQAVQDTNMATETYVTGVRKFFGGKIFDLVDGIIESGNYSEDQAEPLKKIVASMIQKQDILTYKTSGNSAAQFASIAQRRKEFEYKKEQDANSLWGSINGQMTDAVSKETGKSFQQEMAVLGQKGLKGAELEKQTAMIAAKYFPGANVGIGYSADGKKKMVKSFIPATEAAGKLFPKPVYNADGTPARQMAVEVYWNNKWVTKMLTPTQIAGQKNVRIVGKKAPLTKEQKQAYGDVSSGGLYTKVVGTEAIPAYYDSKGDMHYLDPSNEYSVKMYNASANKFTMTRDVEKAYVRKKDFDFDKQVWVEKDVELEGSIYSNATNLSVSGSAATKDLQYGYKIDKAADIYGGEGDFGISTEASGSVITE
jgi:hypothetical protein